MSRKDKLSQVFSKDPSSTPEVRPEGQLPAGNPTTSTTSKRAPFGLNKYAADHLLKPNARYVQEISPDLIESVGPADRMEELDPAAEESLKNSIVKTGQTTPVLLRPDPDNPGRFRIIYGRRRVRALRALGANVKALIRDDISEEDAVIIQGQENSVRKDLTFLERARFLVAIEEEGFARAVAIDALAIDKARASNYAKIGKLLPEPIAKVIGPAPSIGRDRWLAFAAAYEALPNPEAVLTTAIQTPGFSEMDSDARFGAAYRSIIAAQEKKKVTDNPVAEERQFDFGDGKAKVTLAKVKSKNGTLTLTVAATTEDQKRFAVQLNARIDDFVHEEMRRWSLSRDQGPTE